MKNRNGTTTVMRNHVVLITGCSTGIGKALAHRFYYDLNYNVVVTARKKSISTLFDSFEESERFLIRELDITDDDQISSVVSEVFRRWRFVDTIINNAGVCYRSVVEHMDEEAELQQLRTNYLGPMSLIRAVIPAMREHRSGHIINISSVSGMLAMPTMGSYSASKAALQSASEALWYELKPFAVNVSIVQAGFVHSQSFQNIYVSKKAQLSLSLEAPYSKYYAAFSSFVSKLMNMSRTKPEQIANRIYNLTKMNNPPLWVSVTLDAHLFSILRRLLPRSLFHLLMFKMLPNPPAWSQQPLTAPDLLRDI